MESFYPILAQSVGSICRIDITRIFARLAVHRWSLVKTETR